MKKILSEVGPQTSTYDLSLYPPIRAQVGSIFILFLHVYFNPSSDIYPFNEMLHVNLHSFGKSVYCQDTDQETLHGWEQTWHVFARLFTFPLQCFVHVHHACIWKNYIGTQWQWVDNGYGKTDFCHARGPCKRVHVGLRDHCHGLGYLR